MKTKLSIKIFVIAYIAILMLPAIFTFAAKGKEEVNTENRTLAVMPQIKTEEGKFNTDYFTELDSWLSDHIGLRNEMVKANTCINTNIFGNSPEDSIILGNNGWLYYEDTVKDFINSPTFSEKNAKNAAITIRMMQDYVESKGGKFVFTVAPNKNTLYGDNMPYYFIQGKQAGNLELIENAVKEEAVNYADIRTAFINEYEKTGEILYQTTDSHWNYKGALLGYHTIMNGLDIDDEIFSDITFTARDDWEGDLAKMLYSSSAKPDTQLYADYDFVYEYTSRDKAVDSLRLSTSSSKGKNNALIFRDSFFNTLQVYFAEGFANVMFSRAYPYNLNLIDEVEANVVVLEIVERNLPNLVKKAPLMEAPVLDVRLPDKEGVLKENEVFIYKDFTARYVKNTMYSEESNGYTHYYGTIDEDYSGIICFYRDGKVYQAFPIYEQELLGSEELQDNGFSLYVK